MNGQNTLTITDVNQVEAQTLQRQHEQAATREAWFGGATLASLGAVGMLGVMQEVSTLVEESHPNIGRGMVVFGVSALANGIAYGIHVLQRRRTQRNQESARA